MRSSDGFSRPTRGRWIPGLLTACLLATTALAADGELRTWRMKLGQEMEARFVRLAGGSVVLKQAKGRIRRVPLMMLSDEDQAYVRAQGQPDAAAKRERKEASDDFPPTPYLSKTERAVIAEMNLARVEPRRYVERLKKYRRTHASGKRFRRANGSMLVTKEGLPAVDEAIRFMESVKPVGPLSGSLGLSKGARDHVLDTGPGGLIGHDGADGSTTVDRVNRHGKWLQTVGENISYGHEDARGIVMSLIIDDGVADRGHRVNIFKKEFRVAGVAIGKHEKYGVMCVIDYAHGFRDR